MLKILQFPLKEALSLIASKLCIQRDPLNNCKMFKKITKHCMPNINKTEQPEKRNMIVPFFLIYVFFTSYPPLRLNGTVKGVEKVFLLLVYVPEYNCLFVVIRYSFIDILCLYTFCNVIISVNNAGYKMEVKDCNLYKINMKYCQKDTLTLAKK